MKVNTKYFYTLLTFILCSFIGIIFALINKFPLVYSDTGTYIVSGYEFNLPFDRPVFYGLFLRYTSLKLSLWLTILAQSLIAVFLIREMILYYHNEKKNANLLTIVFVFLLSMSSSLSYVVSELIADVFTSYLVLCLLLWQNPNLTKIKRGIITLIFCYSLITHNSHFLIVFAAIACLVMINFLTKSGKGKVIFQLFSLTVIILILNLSFNYFKHKGFKLSRVANTFIFARMLESGAVHKYVKDHNSGGDIITDHINDIPMNSVEFLWNTDQSILYLDSCLPKKGWELCWCEKDGLFKSYIKKVLLYPVSREMYLKNISESFLRQLWFYKVEALGPMTTDYPVKINVKTYLKFDYPSYITAIQYRRVLYFNLTNRILFCTTLLSMTIIIIGMFYLRSRKFNIGIVIFTIFYLVNAFICSAFSNTIERYTTRISWILPLFAIIAIVLVIKKVKDRRSSPLPVV